MPITNSAAVAQFYDASLIANEVIFSLTANRILASLLRTDSQFSTDLGEYSQGKTINIPIIPNFTTNIATTVGGAITFQTPTATNVALTLDSIAFTPFASNDIDSALANQEFRQSYISQMALDHGAKIEQQMFLDTFNEASINANAVGASATAMNYRALRTIYKAFLDAKVPSSVRKIVILSTQQYFELLADTQVARIQNPDNSRTLADGFFEKTLNMDILVSTELATNLALTNITGTGTERVGVAFTADSIVAATRKLPVNNVMGITQQVVSNKEVNLSSRLTVSYDAGVVGGSLRYNLETLFGTKIYRPTTVLPILGGVA